MLGIVLQIYLCKSAHIKSDWFFAQSTGLLNITLFPNTLCLCKDLTEVLRQRILHSRVRLADLFVPNRDYDLFDRGNVALARY